MMVSRTTVSRPGTCLALRMYFRIMTTHQTLETLRRHSGVTALVTTKTSWAPTKKLVLVTYDAGVGKFTGLVCLVDRLPNLFTVLPFSFFFGFFCILWSRFFFKIVKINDFLVELTNISSKKEALPVTRTTTCVPYRCHVMNTHD